MTNPKPGLQDLVNVPTLVTSLLLASLIGLATSWRAQALLQADLVRIEDKVDAVARIIDEAHPRTGTSRPEPQQ